MSDREPPLSKELIPTADQQRFEMLQILNGYDVTMVFNRHRDATDAEKTLELIEPDSIVFIEGYVTGDQQTNHQKTNLLNLARLRIDYGKDSPEYKQYKEALLHMVAVERTKPATGRLDFSQFSNTYVGQLIAQDCVIIQADYDPIASIGSNDQGHLDIVKKGLVAMSANPMMRQPLQPNIAKTIMSMVACEDAQVKMHAIREMHTFAEYASFILRANNALQSTSDLARTKDGLPKVTISYGTAHSDSLVEAFTNKGIAVDAVLLDEPDVTDLVDRNIEAGQMNIPRKVAFRALKNIAARTYYHFGDRLFVDNKKAIYENLVQLNADSEETIKFLIQCIQLNQQLVTNPGAAENWAQNLFTSLLAPEPFDHVEAK